METAYCGWFRTVCFRFAGPCQESHLRSFLWGFLLRGPALGGELWVGAWPGPCHCSKPACGFFCVLTLRDHDFYSIRGVGLTLPKVFLLGVFETNENRSSLGFENLSIFACSFLPEVGKSSFPRKLLPLICIRRKRPRCHPAEASSWTRWHAGDCHGVPPLPLCPNWGSSLGAGLIGSGTPGCELAGGLERPHFLEPSHNFSCRPATWVYSWDSSASSEGKKDRKPTIKHHDTCTRLARINSPNSDSTKSARDTKSQEPSGIAAATATWRTCWEKVCSAWPCTCPWPQAVTPRCVSVPSREACCAQAPRRTFIAECLTLCHEQKPETT